MYRGDVSVMEHHGVWIFDGFDEEPVRNDGRGQTVGHGVLVGIRAAGDRSLAVPTHIMQHAYSICTVLHLCVLYCITVVQATTQ